MTAECVGMPPPPNFGIAVGATPSPAGPAVCVRGQGFTPNGTVQIRSLDAPGPRPEVPIASVTADSAGSFTYAATRPPGEQLAGCGDAERGQPVTLTAKDLTTTEGALATLPRGYWCSNAPSLGDYGGGCR